MASTNPFPRSNRELKRAAETPVEKLSIGALKRRKIAAGETKRSPGNRAYQRKKAVRDSMDHGWPSWDGLKPVLLFILFPGMMGIVLSITGAWPKAVLYPIALAMGAYVFFSAFRTVELVLACMLLYLPFSTTYVIPIAPGVNGTNMLILLGLFASVMAAVDSRQPFLVWPSGTTTVFLFALVTALSAFTAFSLPEGWSHIVHDELLNYKAWIDQFILYFIALSCIRSIDMAKRVVIYMCIGNIVLVLYAVPEMFDKMGGSTIDKSRIGGPHQQANMFGGFVAYTLLPIVALFVVYIKNIKAWLISPFFLIAAKILISTFSRGAYLAMAIGAFLAAYFKGKGFLIFWATMGICVLLLFPSLFPESIKARLSASFSDNQTTEKKLDRSSEDRIILWRAAGKMILEDPITGKGFNAFHVLKSQYTEIAVPVGDPHNTYLYIGSQMGLPALVLFIVILAYSFHMGRKLARNREDLFIKAIGIGGAALTVCYAVICVFGSRAVNLEFTVYFWAYFVVMQVIASELKKTSIAAKGKKSRTNAFEANKAAPSLDDNSLVAVNGASEVAADMSVQASSEKPSGPLNPLSSRRQKRSTRRASKPNRRGARPESGG